MAANETDRQLTAAHGSAWHRMATYGSLWHLDGDLRKSIATYGRAWYHLAAYGNLCHMAAHGILWELVAIMVARGDVW